MAPQSADAIEIFYSYSHIDEGLRDQLKNHLSMLKRQGVVREWHDRRISAGQEWDRQIDAHLNSAHIILLLVSADFLASDYCYDIEVERAMERHEAGEARVIPIILRPCDWQSAPFGRLQALPKDAKPVTKWDNTDDAFLDIAKGIRDAAAEVSSSRSSHVPLTVETPRPTPSGYIPDILRVDFVGRSDNEGNDLIERLKDELAPHKRRLVALWGAGGVGKTALAAEAARALSDDFAQRVVWVSADGREDFSLSTLLDEIAKQLKYEDLRKLALEPKKEQVREVVAAAPTLVVLDNFETIKPEKARPCAEWLAQPALCSALITTRDMVEAAARNIALRHMLSEEAHTFLRRLIAQVHDPTAFEGLDYDSVIETADANPLVLQWIVGQIDLAQSPQEVLGDLKQGEGEAAKRVFDRSFNLKQMNNGGRAVLLALSLFVPGAKRKALAEVVGLDKEKDRKRFREAIKTLSALWFIRSTDTSQRLSIEGLTRELAKARLSRDPRAARIRSRFVSRFQRYAEANAEPTFEHLNSIEDEKDNILSALDAASELKDWNSLMRMASAIREFLTLRGYWDEAIRTGEQGLTAARISSIEQWIALFAHNLAMVYQDRGELLKARRLYDESLEIDKRLPNQRGTAFTLHQLAILAQMQGHWD
ncbi:MAG TPA: toll/interleukin-1 receptor domain-containing protein, partial [Pyrinomonadaceae bacterium]|nr:toll/interleukin-1 receptor domain-containing protein [Pyrinomonadaceae bacterium]